MPTMTAASGARSAAQRRAREAYQLRCMHHTWDAIADAKGYASAASAYKAVKRYIERMPAEEQSMARALSAGNYRLVMGQLHSIAAAAKSQGKPQTAVQALSVLADVQDKHDKLVGLHVSVPQRVDVTVTAAQALDDAEGRLLEALKARPPALPVQAPIDAEVVELAE